MSARARAMDPAPTTIPEHVAALLEDLGARAAGYWRVEGDHLVQVAFVPCADLPEAVARGFAEATRTVPLARTDLGIVVAALRGAPAVSRADDLPPDVGSGYWLRAFGAARSVAVPLGDDRGDIRGVLSVALPGAAPEDRAVAERLRASARGPAAGW